MITGLDIQCLKHPLIFHQPARTSRDTLLEKPTWFLVAKHPDGRVGVGECSLIPGLSPEHPLRAERALQAIAESGTLDPDGISDALPAVRFAVETALIDLLTPGRHILFDGPFARGESGIPINGLIWMGTAESMFEQAQAKLAQGFTTLKWKVGTLPFEEELDLVRQIRNVAAEATLRVDANGAFSADESGWTPLDKCRALAKFGLHSIEQPLKPGNWKAMAELVRESPLPVALDEELIGLSTTELRRGMLGLIRPAYVVLKPSLIGGLKEANHWMDLASEVGAGWWATSALESNIGLNAISQWTADALLDDKQPLPQGLGTGGLFTNNVASPMFVTAGELWTGTEPWEPVW